MSGEDERFPTGMPERRQDPQDVPGEDSRWSLPRAQPRHFTCPCGKPAWRFPERGVGFCGFCAASRADLDARGAK